MSTTVTRWEELYRLLARKSFHVLFVALVAVPLLTEIPLEVYLSLLAFISGVLYSIQVRQPALWEEFRQNFFKSLEDVFNRLEHLLPLDKPELKSQYQRALRQIEELITAAERDYEKRHGYLGIIMGALGFLSALVLFGREHFPASVISLAVYDSVSAVVGTALRGRPVAGKATLPGTLAGAAANTLVLTAAGYPLEASLLITTLVIIADLVSPEDNLTIPLAAAGGSYLYKFLYLYFL
ncbi:MAG: phosphatidate cytidylyltransferase [Pyrobaculum sp.]